MKNYKTQADDTLPLNLVLLIHTSAELHEMVTARYQSSPTMAGTLHWSGDGEQGSRHSNLRDAAGEGP